MLRFAKPTLLVLLVLEIGSLFVLLHIYNQFVSNPKNYMSTAVYDRQAKKFKNYESQLDDYLNDSAGADSAGQ